MKNIYHVTHLDNIEPILQQGILLPDSKIIPVTNFADREIKKARQEFEVKVEPFGCLADYTPFNFVSTTPMFHNITNIQSSKEPPRRQAHFVIIKLKFEPQPDTLINGSPSIVFSAHPLSKNAKIERATPESIKNLVDWRVIHSKDPWGVDHIYQEEWRLRRQAELLIYQGLKLDGAAIKLIVRTDEALKKVDEYLKDSGRNCEAEIDEKYFNHHRA